MASNTSASSASHDLCVVADLLSGCIVTISSMHPCLLMPCRPHTPQYNVLRGLHLLTNTRCIFSRGIVAIDRHCTGSFKFEQKHSAVRGHGWNLGTTTGPLSVRSQSISSLTLQLSSCDSLRNKSMLSFFQAQVPSGSRHD